MTTARKTERPLTRAEVMKASRDSIRRPGVFGVPSEVMTAKEKLRAALEELSENEAAAALDFIARRHERDALSNFLHSAPLDDEPTTADEEPGLGEARQQIARGEVISAEEIRREFA